MFFIFLNSNSAILLELSVDVVIKNSLRLLSEFNFLINVESFLAKNSSRELYNIRVGAAKKMYSSCYPSGNRAHIVCVKSEKSDTTGIYHKIKISRVSGRYVEDLHTFEDASSNRSEYHMSKRGQCKKIDVEKDT